MEEKETTEVDGPGEEALDLLQEDGRILRRRLSARRAHQHYPGLGSPANRRQAKSSCLPLDHIRHKLIAVTPSPSFVGSLHVPSSACTLTCLTPTPSFPTCTLT